MLVGDVRSIMLELKTDKKWKDTIIGVSSQQPVPMWAEECLEKVLPYHICSILLRCVHKLRLFSQFPIGEGYHLKDVLHSNIHVYKVKNKILQIKRISQETGIAPNEMVFFDNQLDNCLDVSKINVTVAYVPYGVTRYVRDCKIPL